MSEPTIIDDVRRLLPEVQGGDTEGNMPIAQRLAEALGWTSGEARAERIDVLADGQVHLLRGTVGSQPAVLSAGEKHLNSQQVVRTAAFFAGTLSGRA